MKKNYILLCTFFFVPLTIISMERKKLKTTTLFNTRIHFTPNPTAYDKKQIKHNEQICIYYYCDQNTNQPIISNITSCSPSDIQNIYNIFASKRDIYSALLEYVDNNTTQPFAFYEKISRHLDNDKNIKVYEISPIKFIYQTQEQTAYYPFSLFFAFILLILSYKFLY